MVDDDERILFVLEHALLGLAPDTKVITAIMPPRLSAGERAGWTSFSPTSMPGQDGISLTSDLRLLIPAARHLGDGHHGPAIGGRRLGGIRLSDQAGGSGRDSRDGP